MKGRLTLGLLGALACQTATAALTWLPSATDVSGGAEYTIKQVYEFSDGSNLITAVEVNEPLPAQQLGCTQPKAATTLFMYASSLTAWQQQLSNKMMAAQMGGYKIKVLTNTGSTNWCHSYGLILWGLEVVVPPQ